MRQLRGLYVVVLLGALAACSGGGGASTPPQPAATLAGAGTPATFNQLITFTINVPAVGAATSARRRHVATAIAASPVATPIATTPYLSPGTGSVVLTLAEVNGISPQQAPPVIAPINVPPTCQSSTTGCTIPVANVPAALGTNRYFVQTFAGANGTGTPISTGFVDVLVPVKSNVHPAIGGVAALSIGGFAATIVLAPAALSFVQGTPSDANVVVEALDGGGATIVGSAQYATAISVSVSDPQFSFNGSPSVTVNGPLLKPLTLHYAGGASFGTLVAATSVDGSGATVSATPIAASVLPPGSSPTPPPPVVIGAPPSTGPSSAPPVGPSPAPSTGPSAAPSPLPTAFPSALPTAIPTPKQTPTPPTTRAISLYVADGQNDTIGEYRIASQINAGLAPNPAATPSRVVKFDPTLAKSPAVGSGGLSCTATYGNGTAGVAVDPNSGSMFILPNCTDGTNGFVFGYPAQAFGTVAPTIYDPFPGGFGTPFGLAVANGSLFAQYSSAAETLYGYGLASNGHQPSVSIATQCYAEFGTPSPGCFNGLGGGFGVDAHGFAYVPAYWNDTPTGDAAAFQQPATMLALRTSASSATVTPYAAIAGLNSTVGGSSSGPLAATVDGSTLYILTGDTTLQPPPNSVGLTNTYFPGLSACPSPSANAPINPLADPTNPITACADGQQHLYVVAYSLTGQLLGPAANGTDVDVIPNFILGGDRVGRFGCGPGTPGQYLAASGGYLYVINLTPTCDTGTALVAPEIDVYNTNGLSGSHTDVAPVFTLPLTTSFPLALTVAPSGSVTGGQALLRAPLTRPYRAGRYGARRPMLRPRTRIRVLHRR